MLIKIKKLEEKVNWKNTKAIDDSNNGGDDDDDDDDDDDSDFYLITDLLYNGGLRSPYQKWKKIGANLVLFMESCYKKNVGNVWVNVVKETSGVKAICRQVHLRICVTASLFENLHCIACHFNSTWSNQNCKN